MIRISSLSSPKASHSIFIVCDGWKNKLQYGFGARENEYITKHFSDKKNKQLTFQSLNRIVHISLMDKKKEKHLQAEDFRKQAAAFTAKINQLKQNECCVCNESSDKYLAIAATEGIALANYQFIKYKASEKKNSLNQIYLIGLKNPGTDVQNLNIAVAATNKARDLVNEPVNHLNAQGLANAFVAMGKTAGFKTTVLNKSKIKALKMGGLLAVNAGSVDEPTFTIMEYKPKNTKNKKPFILVGKGIVFDTGGLSLKPTLNSMDSMKCDMAGAAAVGGAMYAIASAKLNVHVVALVPATDNRPGFNAFAPGDIITMMDGSTVEMLNSDAEGRMILADALHYAKRYKPELVIDAATLTGSAVAAIGTSAIVSMGNASEKYTEKLKKSGHRVFERLAEMPFWDDYNELLKSDIADQKNLGGPYAGSITAGKFLEKFTDYPYYHLDIAGPSFIPARDGYRPKGGTGVGVRLLFDFFQNLYN